jgi:hypothetical protein
MMNQADPERKLPPAQWLSQRLGLKNSMSITMSFTDSNGLRWYRLANGELLRNMEPAQG